MKVALATRAGDNFSNRSCVSYKLASESTLECQSKLIPQLRSRSVDTESVAIHQDLGHEALSCPTENVLLLSIESKFHSECDDKCC